VDSVHKRTTISIPLVGIHQGQQSVSRFNILVQDGPVNGHVVNGRTPIQQEFHRIEVALLCGDRYRVQPSAARTRW
jgi:hypothetical protein